MLTTVLALMLAADTRVAVVDFVGSGVDANLLSYCSQTYAVRQGQGKGLAVTTQQDIAALLGLERQRELLGCGEGSSCLAEFADALGVSAIARGQVALLGGQYLVTVRVVDSKGAALVALTASGPESKLPEVLARLAADTRKGLLGEAATAQEVVGREGGTRKASWAPWIPIGVGVAALGVGGVFLGLAGNNYSQLTSDAALTLDEPSAVQRYNAGKKYQTTGLVLVGCGAAAVAAGVLWKLLLPSSSAVAFSIAPAREGALVSVGGQLP